MTRSKAPVRAGPKAIQAAVLADTHRRAGSVGTLSDATYARLTEADVILHAGDVIAADLLEELAGFAPVHAVLGNNDHALVDVLPETLEVELAGVSVGLIHDSGLTKGRAARMRRRFPRSAVVVFGHSHQPLDEIGIDGQRLFNPGSATQRRRAPSHTMGVLECRNGRLVHHEIVPV